MESSLVYLTAAPEWREGGRRDNSNQKTKKQDQHGDEERGQRRTLHMHNIRN